jgi:DNA replication protein DnaC
MVLTSNLPFAQWDETFGGNVTLTAAMSRFFGRVLQDARRVIGRIFLSLSPLIRLHSDL